MRIYVHTHVSVSVQGNGDESRGHGHGAVQQLPDAAGESLHSGAELPAQAQPEENIPADTGT